MSQALQYNERSKMRFSSVPVRASSFCESDFATLRMQGFESGAESAAQHAYDLLLAYGIRGGLLQAAPNITLDAIRTSIHDFATIVHFLKKCGSIKDFYFITCLAYRLWTNKDPSVWIADRIESLFKPADPVQGSCGDVLAELRAAFDRTQAVTHSPLIKRVISLYSFMLTKGFLARFGLSLDDEMYSKFEKKRYIAEYSSNTEFFMCIVESALFFCERAYEFSITGDISTIMHNSDTYTKWYEAAQSKIAMAPFTSNLEAHNTNYFTFMSELNNVIEQGDSIVKYTAHHSSIDPKYIRSSLNQLKQIKNAETTKRAALKKRAQPFGILVSGSSSVAKSSFADVVYNYYAALHKLDNDDHYRYTRSPTDEYWSNFDSSMWCIQLDDVAFLNPAKNNEVEISLRDLLNVINNVPYVPPQAALEDKGRTPVMAKLVIATTNCENLHAHEYFWCPLAVQRRLPLVVDVKPKKQFIASNGVFIAPEKLVILDGEYPDFWDITVKRVVPALAQGREWGKLEVVETFHDINLFLQYYGAMTITHKKNQERAIAAGQDMRSITICEQCFRPLPHEECVPLNVQSASDVQEGFWLRIANWILESAALFNAMWCLAKYRIAGKLVYAYCDRIKSESRAVALLGQLNSRVWDKRYRLLPLVIGVISTLIVTWKLSSNGDSESDSTENQETTSITTVDGATYLLRKNPKDKVATIIARSSTTEVRQKDKPGAVARDRPSDSLDVATKPELKSEGCSQSVADVFMKEKGNNVWYNPTMELSRFDMPLAGSSLVWSDGSEAIPMFGANCVHLHIKNPQRDDSQIQRGVFLKGQLCLANNHAFKGGKGSVYTVKITRSKPGGLNQNVTLIVNENDVWRDVEHDICIFRVRSLPPFKDITKFWTNTSPQHFSTIVQILRDCDGSLRTRCVYNNDFMGYIPVPSLNTDIEVYLGQCPTPSDYGECGSLSIGMSPRGISILGLHLLGDGLRIGVMNIRMEHIDDLMRANSTTLEMEVQGGGMPCMEVGDIRREFGPLHSRSLFRYIPEGTVNVYGSFIGFRPTPKSKVTTTPLFREISEVVPRVVPYGKPVMNGWEPWRNNVVEMLDGVMHHDESILRACARAYFKDVLRGLDPGWEREVQVLDTPCAINGIPGVKYIDSINRTSSMGFPWNKTKSAYLIACPTEVHCDGVTFDDEIMERIQLVEDNYLEGRRNFPIFSGHLKDEATTMAKIDKRKTRLFTGGPVDWSVVVRKYLLSLVRLIQRNKKVFECMAGLVTQSEEWTDLYHHLTKFGVDRIVGGDYSKFDKHMHASFVLQAFDILEWICDAAGWESAELRVIRGIGMDTAFPVTNIHGDLVEFYGTNPSGHPLTVIINSIVNSLYMRYAYYKLNPDKEATTFQMNVALATYGDDNGSGVSRDVPWYNHTAIQQELAKIGVTYTMADKESVSRPYICIDEFSFLKRTWQYDCDLQVYLAPLDEESIIKSLTYWVPSSSISPEEQMVAVMSSACFEYFFYGREYFERMRTHLVELALRLPYSFYVTDSTFPTYGEMVEAFKSRKDRL